MTRQRICYCVTAKEGWENIMRKKRERMVDISMKSEALSKPHVQVTPANDRGSSVTCNLPNRTLLKLSTNC